MQCKLHSKRAIRALKKGRKLLSSSNVFYIRKHNKFGLMYFTSSGSRGFFIPDEEDLDDLWTIV